MHTNSFTIKKSPFQFIKLIILIEFLFALLPWLLSELLDARRIYESTEMATTVGYPVLTLLVMALLQGTILVVAFTTWYLPTYVVDPVRILYRRGALFAERKLADTPALTNILVHQGPFARRFEYGTLELRENGVEAGRVENIPDPHTWRERILALVDPLLGRADAPPALSITEMIAAGEGQHIEFKSSLMWDYRRERVNKDLYVPVMKNIVGYLNSGGGALIIGVDDDGNILGLDNDYQTIKKPDKDGWENVFNMAFSSMIGLEFRRYVTVGFPELEEKEICVIEVKPAEEPAYLTHKGTETFYIRAGNGSQALSVSKATQYVRSRFGELSR